MKHLLKIAPFVFLIIFSSCKKTKVDDPKPPVIVEDTTVVPGIDPVIANTIGFFLDDWQPKTFTVPDYTEGSIPAYTSYTLTVDASTIITKIPLSEFGQNAVWWMGPVAGDPKFIEPVTNLHPHIIRFPGGSSSDVYFWNAKQGVNPPDAPLEISDENGVKKAPGYNYGMTDYNWQCSLDNYYSMLQQTNNKGIITVNYGYARYGIGPNPVAAAAHLAADWVRYDNGRTQYWEIGNENYGTWEWGYRIDTALNQDGQPEFLTGAIYAQHFKVFVDSMQKAATEIGAKIYIGAVTVESPATEAWQTTCVKTWNTGMMTGINNKADFYVVHNYFTPYNENSSASVIYSSALSVPETMMNFVTQTLKTNGVEVKPIVLDEWNMWAKDSKQQVSNVSGGFALLVLGEALTNKYGMTARWDLLNGWDNGNDHGLFSSGNEPGVSKWSPRPSFYYMYYFQKMLGDRLVSITSTNEVKAYASTYSSGQVNVTLVNTTAVPYSIAIKTKNFRTGNRFYWYSLEGGSDNGEFSGMVMVNGVGPTGSVGGPLNYNTLKVRSAVTENGIKVTVPARGAVIMVIDKK
ncbi:MAG: alpha-L-arabinofuranosidase [Lentimicrobiaceae bacterium]